MSNSFDQAIGPLLTAEGGYVNDPTDRGGETKWGISKRAYPQLNIADLSEDDARAIYRRDYWDRLGLDDVDSATGRVLFNIAVNSGVGHASRLQARHGDNPEALIEAQRDYYKRIVENDPSQIRFAKGWDARMDNLQSEVGLSRRIPDEHSAALPQAPRTAPEEAAFDRASPWLNENNPGGLEGLAIPEPTESTPLEPIDYTGQGRDSGQATLPQVAQIDDMIPGQATTAERPAAPNSFADTTERKAAREWESKSVLEKAGEYTSAFSTGFRAENSVVNMVGYLHGLDNTIDPDYQWENDEQAVADLKAYVPEGEWSKVTGDLFNRAELQRRILRYKDATTARQSVRNFGWTAGIGGFTGAVLDWQTVVAAAPVFSNAAIVSQTSRVKNMLSTMGSWGASSAAMEAVANPYRPMSDASDILMAGGLGAVFGVMGARLPVAASTLGANKRTVEILDREAAASAGVPLPPVTPTGEVPQHEVVRRIVKEGMLDLEPEAIWTFGDIPTVGSRLPTDDGMPLPPVDGVPGRTAAEDAQPLPTVVDPNVNGFPAIGDQPPYNPVRTSPERRALPGLFKNPKAPKGGAPLTDGPTGPSPREIPPEEPVAPPAPPQGDSGFPPIGQQGDGGFPSIDQQGDGGFPPIGQQGDGGFPTITEPPTPAADPYAEAGRTYTFSSHERLWKSSTDQPFRDGASVLGDIASGKSISGMESSPTSRVLAGFMAEALSRMEVDALGNKINVYFDEAARAVSKRWSADGKPGTSMGTYNPVTREIRVKNSDMPDAALIRDGRLSPDEVLLHEMGHGILRDRIAVGFRAMNQRIDNSLTAAVKRLQASHQKVATDPGIQAMISKDPTKWPEGWTEEKAHNLRYAVSNGNLSAEQQLHEFASQILSGNKNILDAINAVDAAGAAPATKKKKKGLLATLYEAIAEIMGINPRHGSALAEAFSAIEDIAAENARVSFRKAGASGAEPDVSYDMLPSIPSGDHMVDAAEAAAAEASGINTSYVFGWGLGLENKLLSRRVPEKVREFAGRLIGTTVGYADRSVVQANAWDSRTLLSNRWTVGVAETVNTEFKAWAKAAGRFDWVKRGEAWEEFNAHITEFIRKGGAGEVDEPIRKAASAIQKQFADIVGDINDPGRHLGKSGTVSGLTQKSLGKDPVTGEEMFTKPLATNESYIPRMYETHKWNEATAKHGRKAVEDFFAKSIKAANEDVDDELAEKLGRWYVANFEEARLNKIPAIESANILTGRNVEALKASLIKNGGFDEDSAMRFLIKFFPEQVGRASESGGQVFSANLKNRTLLDEGYTSPEGISLSSLTNNNATDVFQKYADHMAGAVSLAAHTGAKSRQDIERMVLEKTRMELGHKLSEREVIKIREDLDFAVGRIMGYPVEERSGFLKSMEMFRAWNVARLMGGAVFNQIVEFSQIIGSLGITALGRGIPEYRSLMRRIKDGQLGDDEARYFKRLTTDLATSPVARWDFQSRHDWQDMTKNRGDLREKHAGKLDMADTGLQRLAKGVLDVTGMNGLTMMQRRFHAINLVRHFQDEAEAVAKGAGKSTLLTPARLAWMGLDKDSAKNLYGALNSNTKGGTMDWAAFEKNHPELNAKLQIAVQRESRRVVQENDLASMVPIMARGWAQTLFQFQNFVFQAWNKSLMFGLNHRDASTAMTVLYGSLIGSAVYGVRTAASSLGMSEEERAEFLATRLSPGQIAASGIGRIAQASVVPQLFDIISPVPMFSGLRTTSDVSSLAANPTLQTVNSLVQLKNILAASAGSETQVSAKDVRTGLKLIPFNNVVGIQGAFNAVAAQFPDSSKQFDW